MSVAAGHRVRRSGPRIADGREYFPSRCLNETLNQCCDPVSILEVMVERFFKDLDWVVLGVDADIRDGDDGLDPRVDVLVAHAGCKQYADDDFQGGRLVRPSEQSLKKLATVQFLTSVQAGSHQLTADPQEGAVPYRSEFRHHAFRLHQNDPHMDHRVSLHDGDKGLR